MATTATARAMPIAMNTKIEQVGAELCADGTHTEKRHPATTKVINRVRLEH